MLRRTSVLAFLAAALAGCGPTSVEQVREEATRLRGSFEKHRVDYLQSIEAGNRLAAESLAWLNGPAISAPRTQAVAFARALTDRWARVYFVPRYMHGQLRFHQYSTQPVKDVHRNILDRLQRSYFELHDYQRYAQRAAESSLHGALPGWLSPQLLEFRRRLEGRPAAVDEITPLLDSLPR